MNEPTYPNELTGNILITGGTGTLGKAILRRAYAEEWDAMFTVFSRDPAKQAALQAEFPGVRCALGDIRDYDALYKVMIGHTMVIHAAAQKHIPQAELNPTHCIETNVTGSSNVVSAAERAGVDTVIGISTDKVCYPINIYGASKLAMERLFLEANRYSQTQYKLCRYGNVIGSNGSVWDLWKRQIADGKRPTITHPDMTRFWISEDDAVDLVIRAAYSPLGTIVVPNAPALSMERFARFLLGEGTEVAQIGLRPGEKMHECLITAEEWATVKENGDHFLVYGRLPSDPLSAHDLYAGLHSNDPLEELSGIELRDMVGLDTPKGV